jgi:hypothetical protein
MAEAARVLGSKEAARSAAREAGRYELDGEAMRALGLSGVELGGVGEIPALSPERWAALPTLAGSQGIPVGLILNGVQSEAFSRFLARNHVSQLTPERAVLIARHFFHAEPVQLVLR